MKLRDAIFYAIASAWVAACLDLSPVKYVAKDAGTNPDEDAGPADAGTSDAGNYVEECNACLAMMCTTYDACNADAKCSVMNMCMTDTKCWNEPIVDFNNPPMCISACASKAGLVSQVDPALGPFTTLLICAQSGECAPACAPDLVKK